MATVMLRKASRIDYPWQYRRSPGGLSVATGDRPYHDSWSGETVYDDIDGLWDRTCRQKQSGGTVFVGTDYCMTG